MEDKDKLELYQEENKQLVEQVHHVMDQLEGSSGKSFYFADFVADFALEEDGELIGPNVGIGLAEFEELDDAEGLTNFPFDLLPSNFQFPIYCLHKYVAEFVPYHEQIKQGERIVTPKGIMPTIVMGADNKYYSLLCRYMINDSGQAFKFTDVKCISDSNNAKAFEEALNKPTDSEGLTVQWVDFIPDQTLSSPMPLDANDYEIIKVLLNQIESGKAELISLQLT